MLELPPAGLVPWDKISLLGNLYNCTKKPGLNKIASEMRDSTSALYCTLS